MRALQIALLVPQPPLTLLYLVRLRFGRVVPTYFPLLVLSALPLVALAIGHARLRRGAPRSPGFEAALVGASIVELLWGLAGVAVVAIALRAPGP